MLRRAQRDVGGLCMRIMVMLNVANQWAVATERNNWVVPFVQG